MITTIPPRGATPEHLLIYLLSERSSPPSVLATNLAGSTRRAWARQIETLAATHRPRMDKFVKHLILSFAPGEELPRTTLIEIANRYLAHMGYGEAPFVAVHHTETAHHHLHLVTTPVTFGGKKVSQSWDWRRSEEAAREIERLYNLRAVPSPTIAKPDRVKKTDRKIAERTGSPSERAATQAELRAVARDCDTLCAFVERLAERGIQTRVLLDRAQVLRGISFARGELHFSGQQLGRDFKAGHLLEALGLRYNPDRDAAALLAFAAPHPRKETLMEPIRQSALATDPAPKAATLPTTTYQVATVPAAIFRNDPYRLNRDVMGSMRNGVTLDNLPSHAERLNTANKDQVVLMRIDPKDRNMIGFRNVDGEALGRMKADGVNPAVVVEVGKERYDVILRAHRELSDKERDGLRTALAEKYELKPSRGVYADAVRMPGYEVSPDLPQRRAVLTEADGKPFRASEALLDHVGEKLAQVNAAEKMELPPKIDETPGAVVRTMAAERAALPDDSRLAPVQKQIDLLARAGEPGADRPHGHLTNNELISQAFELNRELATAAVEGKAQSLARTEPAVKLVEHEAEIALRMRSMGDLLKDNERKVEGLHWRLEQLTAGKTPGSDLFADEDCKQAYRNYTDFAGKQKGLEREYVLLEHTQARLDSYRFATAAFEAKGAPEALKALDSAIRRELDLAERLGAKMPDLTTSGIGKRASTAEHLEALRHNANYAPSFYEKKDVSQVSVLHGHRRALCHAEGLETHVLRPQLPAAGKTPEAKQITNHLEANRPKGPALEPLNGDGAWQRLRAVAKAVAEGDLSPQALRRLTGAIVASAPAEKLSLQIHRPPEGTKKMIERTELLGTEVRSFAAKVANDPKSLTAPEYSHLLSRSSEAVQIHGQLEAQYRQLLKIADPGEAPRDVSKTAWNVAWLKAAESKGLDVASAAQQLANASRVPLQAPLALTGKAAGAALFVARQAAMVAHQHFKQALNQ